MRQSNQRSPVGIGTITILTVLLILCLSIFSALTLSTANGDLALSERNAQTVSAWYEADAEAARLYADFAAGSAPELEEQIAMSDTHYLYLHLLRGGTGDVQILAWQMTATEDTQEPGDQFLPVYTEDS
ncbi:MAG: hypothetical protein LUG13_05650 [Oscillospiraceae bacterium]|nr:hypothetical protein [Oscillospiraceae bacterium]